MDTKAWDKPITFEENSRGRFRTITNTEEAAIVLLQLWPTSEGPAYRKARQAALDVMMGKRKPAEARKAFLAAADEAHVFIRNN